MKKLLVVCTILVGCGKDGMNGSVGPVGPPGAQIGIVKLCLGDTVYPSTFVENAFCIDNRLYAVYSENDGFLTEIPPGAYSSNAINSRCNFSVLPNCVIQN